MGLSYLCETSQVMFNEMLLAVFLYSHNKVLRSRFHIFNKVL